MDFGLVVCYAVGRYLCLYVILLLLPHTPVVESVHMNISTENMTRKLSKMCISIFTEHGS